MSFSSKLSNSKPSPTSFSPLNISQSRTYPAKRFGYGTLLDACAGIKSFKLKEGGNNDSSGDDNQGIDFHGKKLKNEPHESTTDADARLFRKVSTKKPNSATWDIC